MLENVKIGDIIVGDSGMKQNHELVVNGINREVYGKLKHIDLDGMELANLELIFEALDTVVGWDEFLPTPVYRYLECLKEMFEDEIEACEKGKPQRTTEEIMKEYGLNEADYH